MEGSRAQSFDINNENLRRIQRGEAPAGTGEVRMDYFGHSCIRVVSPQGLSVLIDPWRNDAAWGWWFPIDFPEITVDIALSTHAHFDHDALHIPKARITMERLVGTFSLGDVRITGLADKHMNTAVGKTRWTEIQKDTGENFLPPTNNLHMDNCILVLETGGVTIVHWGDNRPEPDGWVRDYLKNIPIDVLLLPVDESEHILSYAQADTIMREYSPALTVPVHYLTHGVNTVLSTLQPAEPWVRTHAGAMNIAAASLTLKKDQYPREGKTVATYGSNYTLE